MSKPEQAHLSQQIPAILKTPNPANPDTNNPPNNVAKQITAHHQNPKNHSSDHPPNIVARKITAHHRNPKNHSSDSPPNIAAKQITAHPHNPKNCSSDNPPNIVAKQITAHHKNPINHSSDNCSFNHTSTCGTLPFFPTLTRTLFPSKMTQATQQPFPQFRLKNEVSTPTVASDFPDS